MKTKMQSVTSYRAYNSWKALKKGVTIVINQKTGGKLCQ